MIDMQRVMTAEIQGLDHVMERLGEVAHATSLSAGIEAVLDGARQAFGFDYGSAWAVRDGSDHLDFVHQVGAVGAELLNAFKMLIEEPVRMLV